ncbi:MAG: hypothetical protein ACYC7D_02670 [Nitrososphaerales archaeon]
MPDYNLKELFANVERYAFPLTGRDSQSSLSKDENRILALQNVNRLNQRMGFLVREQMAELGEMRLLQTFVNSLTLGLKTDNVLQIKSALTSVRNVLKTLDP